jgi:hypothetical protein
MPEDESAKFDSSIFVLIAQRVRADSKDPSCLTRIEELEPLIFGKRREQIILHIAELIKIEEYQDIKVLISSGGAAYLYSDTFINPKDASGKALEEETQERIAFKVRADSAEIAQLTAIKSLPDFIADVAPDQIRKFVETMMNSDRYRDIRSVTGAAEAGYLYCITYVTENYARLLARVEARDPLSIIAETVREESRIYPRATKMDLFHEPVFQIDAGLVSTAVESISQREEFRDIKKIVAPTGAVYLFSDLYMSDPQARAFVRWEEVEKLNNP